MITLHSDQRRNLALPRMSHVSFIEGYERTEAASFAPRHHRELEGLRLFF